MAFRQARRNDLERRKTERMQRQQANLDYRMSKRNLRRAQMQDVKDRIPFIHGRKSTNLSMKKLSNAFSGLKIDNTLNVDRIGGISGRSFNIKMPKMSLGEFDRAGFDLNHKTKRKRYKKRIKTKRSGKKKKYYRNKKR